MPLAVLRKAKFAAKIQQSFDKCTIKQRKNFLLGYKNTLGDIKTSEKATDGTQIFLLCHANIYNHSWEKYRGRQ